MLVLSTPKTDPIEMPSVELLREWIVGRGDEDWLYANGDVGLVDYQAGSDLVLMKKEGLGVFVRYAGPEGTFRLVAPEPPAAGFVFYPGGQDFPVEAKHLVTPLEALAVAVQFCFGRNAGALPSGWKWDRAK